RARRCAGSEYRSFLSSSSFCQGARRLRGAPVLWLLQSGNLVGAEEDAVERIGQAEPGVLVKRDEARLAVARIRTDGVQGLGAGIAPFAGFDTLHDGIGKRGLLGGVVGAMPGRIDEDLP